MKGLVRNVYSEYSNLDTAVYSSSRIFYDADLDEYGDMEYFEDDVE